MAEQSNAELIAEVNEKLAAHQWTSDWGVEMLAGILAERLEAADQLAEIRGETIRTYERENADWERRVHIAERKAAEYAAVVEKVQGLEPMWPRGMYGCPQDMFGRRQLQEALATTPEDALRELKADVWDEGRESVALDFMRPPDEAGMRTPTPNPYRQAKRVLMTHPHDGHDLGDTCLDCQRREERA